MEETKEWVLFEPWPEEATTKRSHCCDHGDCDDECLSRRSVDHQSASEKEAAEVLEPALVHEQLFGLDEYSRVLLGLSFLGSRKCASGTRSCAAHACAA